MSNPARAQIASRPSAPALYSSRFGEDAAIHAAGTADRQNGVPFWNAHVWRRCLWRGGKSGDEEEGYGLDLVSLLVVGVEKMAPDGA
jgi:hypothetical protein